MQHTFELRVVAIWGGGRSTAVNSESCRGKRTQRNFDYWSCRCRLGVSWQDVRRSDKGDRGLELVQGNVLPADVKQGVRQSLWAATLRSEHIFLQDT